MLSSHVVSDDLTGADVRTLLSAQTCRQILVWSFGLALFSEGLGLSIVIVLVIVLVDINQLLEVDFVS
jgi:hypothetical protein